MTYNQRMSTMLSFMYSRRRMAYFLHRFMGNATTTNISRKVATDPLHMTLQSRCIYCDDVKHLHRNKLHGKSICSHQMARLCPLTLWQISMCFLRPSIDFLVTNEQVGHTTSPCSGTACCHWLPGSIPSEDNDSVLVNSITNVQ